MTQMELYQTWIGSPNFTKGRSGKVVLGVVIHVTEGSLASVDSWFRNPASKVSAHLCVGRSGKIHEYVLQEDTAWHAGRVDKPNARLILENPGVNPNSMLLGFEFEGDGKSDFTEEQYVVGAQLLVQAARRWGFKLNRNTVIPHRDIYSRKTCPGPVDIDRLILLAVRLVVPPPAPVDAPALGSQCWSDYLGSWITLVRYASDTDWHFTVNGKGVLGMDTLEMGILKGHVPFSQMPKAKS